MATLTDPGLVTARRRRRRREIAGLIGRRVALLVPLLIVLSAGVFLLADLSPFDSLLGYLGDRYRFATPEQRAALTDALQLDRAWWAAWAAWLSDVARGDFGQSRSYAMPVLSVVGQRLPWTLLLSAAGLLIALALGLLGGLAAALRPGSLIDRAAHALAVVTQAVPPFVLAMAAIAVGSLSLGLFPAGGAFGVTGESTPASVLHHLVLPALVLGVSQTPWLLLSVRAEVTSALASDAVRAAVARGIPWRRVVTGHVLPICLAPLVTLLGVRLPELVVGAVLVEEVFAWPGLAAALVTSARTLDLPLLAFLTLASTVLVLLGSLAADVAYLILDPRVRVDD